MRLYIKAYSSYRSDLDDVEIKKVLKQKYKYDTRRQDEFIHLAVYGAKLLQEKTHINEDNELYVTSGVGNIDVVQRTNTTVYENHESVKLFDFINLLGNTTSYYIASALKIKGKNIFQISDNFTFINSLISIYSSIKKSKKYAILCAIDVVSKIDEVTKRVMGINENSEVISAVNYQQFSLDATDALAEIEFDATSYTLDEINTFLESTQEEVKFSFGCKALKPEEALHIFETYPSYIVNSSIKVAEDLIYIDCYEEKYKIIKVKNLK